MWPLFATSPVWGAALDSHWLGFQGPDDIQNSGVAELKKASMLHSHTTPNQGQYILNFEIFGYKDICHNLSSVIIEVTRAII